MVGIDDKQEAAIDRAKRIHGEPIYRVGDEVVAKGDSIIMYGDVDVNDKEDANMISQANLVNEDNNGNPIPSKFDYDTGTCVANGKVQRYFDTTDAVLNFKYHHVLIGKPSKVIVYKVHKDIDIKNNYGRFA